MNAFAFRICYCIFLTLRNCYIIEYFKGMGPKIKCCKKYNIYNQNNPKYLKINKIFEALVVRKDIILFL